MRLLKSLLTAAVLTTGMTAAANATIVTIFDGIAAGRTTFNTTVTGAGGTVANDVWASLGSGTSIDRGAYTITRNNGGSMFPTIYSDMSGQVVSINPDGDGSNPRTAPMGYFGSGVTLTFGSAVNSIGFEVGDWATCCFDPTTDLYISFDDGTPILVASADSYADGLFPSQVDGDAVNAIFVAAFDDTGDFTKVSFWGNGIGEYLVFGGDVRYA
ncbi:MAG: hypothetical protein ACK4MS_16140, partial [Paracoccaceae bacterium]